MSSHIFVDESKRRDFILVAAVMPSHGLEAARQQLQTLYLPGQHGIHMVKESDGRKRSILRMVAGMNTSTFVYVSPKGAHATQIVARHRCLEAMFNDFPSAGDLHLCLERDDSLAFEDRQVIRRQVRESGLTDRLSYGHSKVGVEPLLAVPDVIAWAWPQGGRWRSMCPAVAVRVLAP